MRTRSAITALLLAIGGIATATPANDAYGAVIEAPPGAVYAPFGGPVQVSFTFEDGDPARVFTLRLREPGEGTIKEKDLLVDPGSETSPVSAPFGWKDLSVTRPTEFVVDVRRQGANTVMTSERFTVLPRLVSDVTASPSPFYPVIDDGYRDTTTFRFSLSADAIDTELRIFEADAFGRCCGDEIRAVDLGALAAGRRSWEWDGTVTGSTLADPGTYHAKVTATDTDDVSATSRAVPVELATGIVRLTDTREKNGSAYAAVADEQTTALGGDCSVVRDAGANTARALCVSAEISVIWRWSLADGERIEAVSFAIDGGSYGCHAKKSFVRDRSVLRLSAPPTSLCIVSTARITYSYRYHA